MKKIFTTLLAAGLALSAIDSVAQEKAEEAQQKTKSVAEDAANASWENYMAVGDMHKMLASANGDWKAEMKFWMAPGAEPQVSTASCVNKMILGDRYQESTFEGTVMGMPFEGRGLVGYDNIKKTFNSIWIDNMGTGTMVSEGTYDEKTNTINFKGSSMDPMSGKEVKNREVYKMINDNHHVFELYSPGADGKEFKTMEINYRR